MIHTTQPQSQQALRVLRRLSDGECLGLPELRDLIHEFQGKDEALVAPEFCQYSSLIGGAPNALSRNKAEDRLMSTAVATRIAWELHVAGDREAIVYGPFNGCFDTALTATIRCPRLGVFFSTLFVPACRLCHD